MLGQPEFNRDVPYGSAVFRQTGAFILTRDSAALKRFYSNSLGSTLLTEDDFATVYDLNGITLSLTTVEDHNPPTPSLVGSA